MAFGMFGRGTGLNWESLREQATHLSSDECLQGTSHLPLPAPLVRKSHSQLFQLKAASLILFGGRLTGDFLWISNLRQNMVYMGCFCDLWHLSHTGTALFQNIISSQKEGQRRQKYLLILAAQQTGFAKWNFWGTSGDILSLVLPASQGEQEGGLGVFIPLASSETAKSINLRQISKSAQNS